VSDHPQIIVRLHNELVEAREVVARIRALHRSGTRAGGVLKWCVECGKPDPCPTLRAFNGEEGSA